MNHREIIEKNKSYWNDHADRGAGELWGIDFSRKQLDNAAQLLKDHHASANLICARMENEWPVPKEYFDYVDSIYGFPLAGETAAPIAADTNDGAVSSSTID